MFDCVKHVQDQMTLACHVYNLLYCKVMTITIYDMQLVDTKAQCVMWCKLNKVMLKKGVPNLNFKGSMANSA